MKNYTKKDVALPVLATVYALLAALSIVLFLFPETELSLLGMEFGGNVMMGFVMLVVAGILWFGFSAGRRNPDDQLSFAFVGTGLAVMILFIQIMLLLVDSFNALILGMEDYELWTVMDSIHPAMLPGLIALVMFIGYRKQMNDVDPSLPEGETC